MLDIFGTEKRRKPFNLTTKKTEWLLAAGRNPYGKFYQTSKCRVCKRQLTWGDRSYDFDHKDNNSGNNRQNNCWLVCKVCHGKHTKMKVVKERGLFGEVMGHKTIKLKVGYKKSTVKKPTKKRKQKKSSSIFDF